MDAVLTFLSFFSQRQECAQYKKQKGYAAFLDFQEHSAQKDLSGHVVSLPPPTDTYNITAFSVLQGWKERQYQRNVLSTYSFQRDV